MSRGWSSYVLKLHPIGDVAGDALLLGLLRILRVSGTKYASLLGKSALRHQLLAL